MSSKQTHRARRAIVAIAGVAAAAAAARTASGQIDTNPPLQNVMLLVDTSGSMEYASDGSNVTCDQVDASLPNEPKGAPTKSRWTQVVEVLTGDVQNYSCYTQDRRSNAFREEYKLANVNSYDHNYHVPYHRILSATGCTVGAGVADANPFLWGTTPFKYHLWNDASKTCTTFQQAETGLLDAYRDRVRFGLMTFDTSVDAGTGLSGLTSADSTTGQAGTWSYFLDWRTSSDCNANASCAKGRPAGCAANSPMEVGARNAAAPPWEGRMVPFGSPVADVAAVRTSNQHIQQVLTAVRPFGATPINGLLSDARDFFRADGDADYVNGQTCDTRTGIGCFGPKHDAFVAEGCRKNFIILLTDGEPNLDLRPYCEGTSNGLDGVCPYKDKSFEIVKDLAHPTDGRNPIKTYVIGFAVSSVDTGQPLPIDCTQISSKGANGAGDTFDPKNLCGPSMDPRLSACCTLAKVAFYGESTNAYFATNATELRTAMAAILRSIDAKVSTRTMPVFGSASNETFGGAFSFYSSFRADSADVWSGVLERQRTKCVPETAGQATVITAKDLPIDANQGDSFSDNINAADGSHPRQFYTVIADADAAGLRGSDRSIRPSISASNPDGIGIATGTLVSGTATDFFAPKIPATAMRVTKSSCTDKPLPATDDDCARLFMKWEIATDNAPYQKRTVAFGAIYHSTPVLVGAPNEFLRDESYTQFTVEQAKRPPVLYTSTTDGQLHAFKVDKSPADKDDTFTIDKKVNNELWAFFPPAALPRIAAQYPSSEQVILDGAPVVKNVVFSRNDAEAKNGGAVAKWRTVLVSGFGGGGPGYFAVDITNPVPKTGDAKTGPKMLWQLTTDDTGQRLFGKRSGTPAIAMLFFSVSGEAPQEYAVAILPGGESDGPTTGACPQLGTSDLVDPARPPRKQVRCWANDAARSLTVVRLDTGEVVRSFRGESDGPASVLARSRDSQNRFTPVNAPISGQPVIFPATTGAVADRAFVGDRDGMLWRVDLSSQDPRQWTMKLFFDAYTGPAFDAGQPISTPPVLSVDRVGNVTVAFSTGDQETFLATTGMQNFLWSLLEQSGASPAFQSKVLWSKTLTDGERVSGPMSLFSSTLFYTTFTPPPINADKKCTNGQSKLCGVHYMQRAAEEGQGGAPGIPPLNKDNPTEPCMQFGESIIFGAGITQKPTCNAEATFDDPYLGFGHTGLININPGRFQLVVQTGPGGASQTGGQINTRTIELTAPMTTTRIDSWASVIE